MRTKFAQFLIVASLVVSIGGHWAILQSIAWVGMAISYSKNAPLTDALVQTFDGKHPCQLCKAVKAGKQAERKEATLKVETKLDFWLARPASLLDAPMPFVVLPGESDSVQPRAEPPPTPPPRLA